MSFLMRHKNYILKKNVIFYLFICPIKFKVYIKLKTVFFKIKKLYFLDLYKVYT